MKILVTGSGGMPGQRIAAHLGNLHEVVAVDGSRDIRDPAAVRQILPGVASIVHAGALTDLPPDIANDDSGVLDWSARSTYVLMDEAVKCGIRRVVLLSSLSLFDDCPDTSVIDEGWRPRPRPEAASLAPLMAERTCREFSRQKRIESVCIRVGDLAVPEGTPALLMLEAIQRAVEMEVDPESYRFWLYHVSGSPRFPLNAAKRAPLSIKEEG